MFLWINVDIYMYMYMFDILVGAFVKKLVFIFVCVCVCVCVFVRWKSTQSFVNTVDNVGNILKLAVFIFVFFV